MKYKIIFKEYGWFTLGFILLFLGIFFFSNSVRGLEATAHFFDPSRITTHRSEAIVVGIDDKSLQALGAWPWNRSIFADVTTKLNKLGAKVIVYDVLFLEPRAGDDIFKKALEQSKIPVILASKNDNSAYLESFLSNSTPLVISALANVMPDSDGKVRLFPANAIIKERCVDSLSHEVFSIYIRTISTCEDISKFSFRNSVDIKTVSVLDVLNSQDDNLTFKDKVVFIGSVSLDLPDHFIGMNGSKVAGVYVHASIFNSLLNKDLDSKATPVTSLAYLLFFALITTLLTYRLRSLVAQLIALFIILGGLFILNDIYFEQHSILPAPHLFIAVILFTGYTILYRFLKERKQNDYIKNLFSKYVDKDVLKELLVSGAELRLGGEKREVTVLFSDLRGFTTLSESMTPEELTSTLNAYLSAMSPVILKEKGTIDKYIGDAIMAFWNAPLFTPEHQLRAVVSALTMQDDLKSFNVKNNTTLAMGVGVHTGEVVVGNVGSVERVNYTILGDVVNNTSRLEGLTKRYGVGLIVTQEIKDKISEKTIFFRKLDIITVKGKHLPTIIYEAMWSIDTEPTLMSDYEIAFEEYEKGDFINAKRHFKYLSDKGDKPSEKMLERLNKLGDSKPQGWDGIWRFDEK